MAKANVYNMAGQQVGEIELSEAVFGIEPNQAVVHEVVKNHLANCRQGTQSALTRAEVSGGGKKPWRQKGTGHARQGSTRAPQWTHGGIVFAPKPRSYSYALNKKVKRLALKSALSAKAASGDIKVVDGLKLEMCIRDRRHQALPQDCGGPDEPGASRRRGDRDQAVSAEISPNPVEPAVRRVMEADGSSRRSNGPQPNGVTNYADQ